MKEDLEYVVLRSIILSSYISEWGFPKSRYVFDRGENIVEIYAFPPRDEDPISRFATVGVSAGINELGSYASHEMYLALAPDIEETIKKEVCLTLMNIAEYSYRADVNFSPDATIPPISSAPTSWTTRAVLIQEPLGEREVSSFQIYDRVINLFWLMLIHESEYRRINSAGIEPSLSAMLAGIDKDPWSIVNPNRQPYIQ